VSPIAPRRGADPAFPLVTSATIGDSMRIKIAPALALGLAVTAAACGRKGTEAGASESRSKAPEPTLSVTEVEVGRTINADKSIADHTGDFKPKETIYVSVATAG